MDFKQLRALVTVAETGNVTRAAKVLNIVQPAVSRQLRLLEEDVGAVLFDRGRYGMRLTDEGRTLVAYARRILDEIECARAEVSPAEGEIGGIVTVGLLPSTGSLLSSPLVAAAAKRYPGIRIRISMGYAGTLQAWLESGEIDAALLYDPQPTPTIRVQPLLEEHLWVVGLPEHGLSSGSPVALSELAGRALIVPSAPHGLRTLVDHAARLKGLVLRVVAETNAMSVQKSLVVAGHGLTILPSIAVADDVAQGLLSAAPLKDPALVRKIVLAVPANRQITTPVHRVVNILTACMRGGIQRGDWPGARWLGNDFAQK